MRLARISSVENYPVFSLILKVFPVQELVIPNPRVPDATKRLRGTFRADRAEGRATDEEPEAVTEYKALAKDAYARAIKGFDVREDIAYLRQAEKAFQQAGITTRDGQPWSMSFIAECAMNASKNAFR